MQIATVNVFVFADVYLQLENCLWRFQTSERLGQQCIEYAEPLPKTPETLYRCYQTSTQKHPDFTNAELWDALDKGRRPLREALAILQQAEEQMNESVGSDDQSQVGVRLDTAALVDRISESPKSL